MMYYVYSYLREDGSPYYIGKGKGQRLYSKQRTVSKPPQERITIILDNLTEEESFEWERFFIAAYGRKDNGTGILHNRTDGGEGLTGHIKSFETRRKTSETLKRKGIVPPSAMPGCKRSESWKQKMGDAHAKEYVITYPSGETVIVKNLKQFCSENDIKYVRMTETARGVRKHYKGMTVKLKR